MFCFCDIRPLPIPRLPKLRRSSIGDGCDQMIGLESPTLSFLLFFFFFFFFRSDLSRPARPPPTAHGASLSGGNLVRNLAIWQHMVLLVCLHGGVHDVIMEPRLGIPDQGGFSFLPPAERR